MKRTAALILSLILSACASNAADTISAGQTHQERLTVFAAASLTEAFGEIVTVFQEIHPGVVVTLNLAGSNTLRAQIEQGASADVFASANIREMDVLIEENFVNEQEKFIFLTNRLVVITPASNPAGITVLKDLIYPGTIIVTAAEEVPVGRYSRLMLEKFGAQYKSQVMANVVSNETTVKQVVAKVQLGEADAGIVYYSDAVAAQELGVIEIPIETNVLADYLIAPLASSSQPELADLFIAFVLSQKGQDALKKWGFTPPTSPGNNLTP